MCFSDKCSVDPAVKGAAAGGPAGSKHYSPPRTVRPSPYTTPSAGGAGRKASTGGVTSPQQQTSPSRPSTLPVQTPTGTASASPSSPSPLTSLGPNDPIPVPSQVADSSSPPSSPSSSYIITSSTVVYNNPSFITEELDELSDFVVVSHADTLE